MTFTIAELGVELRLEGTDEYRQQLNMLRGETSEFAQVINSAFGGSNIQMPKLHLEPTVDHEPLHGLNKHLDKKGDHVRELNRFMAANPIKPRVDDSELQKLAAKAIEVEISFNAESIKKIVADVELQLTTSIGSSVRSAQSESDRLSKQIDNLAKATERSQRTSEQALKRIDSSIKTSANAIITKDDKGVIGSLISPLTSTIKQITTGFNERVGASFADPVGRGATAQFEKITGIDLEKTGTSKINELSSALKSITDVSFNALGVDEASQKQAVEAFRSRVQESFNQILPETGQIKRVGDEIADILGKSFLKASFKLGDGIAATFGASSYLNMGEMFVQEVFDLSAFRSELNDIINQVRSLDFNVFPERQPGNRDLSVMGEVLDPLIRSRRMQGLRMRAVPMVEERAQEIASSQRTSGRNATVVRDEEIERLIIAIGGYANARGLSGARIAKQINAETGDGTKAIFVKNPDTDLSSARAAQNRQQAFAMSLLKPNLRGFSPDSVEMAAQAAAARQINPNVKIELIGESGGGFVVEEVAEILKMMGIDGVSDISVGTPDFVGRLNQQGDRKIFSPDEPLGQDVFEMIAPRGLFHSNNPQQNVLGLQDHQFEFYRQARIPELMNSIFGAPEAFSSEEIQELKANIDAGKELKTSDLSAEESQKVAFDAMASANDVRRRIILQVGDDLNELEMLAKDLQAMYLKFATETDDIKLVRQNVEAITQSVEDLETAPSIDSEAAQKQLDKVRRLQVLGREAFQPAFGTERAQFEQLDLQFTQLGQRLESLLPAEMSAMDMSNLAEQMPDPDPVMVEVDNAQLTEYEKIGETIGRAAVEAMRENIPDLFQGVQVFDDSILDKINNFREAAKDISTLAGARPNEAIPRLDTANRLLPNLLEEVDQMIAAIPADQRMTGEGALAANAKSQLTKLAATFEQLNQQLAPQQNETIDGLGDINKLIKSIGDEFKSQAQSAKALTQEDPEKAQAIARELLTFQEQYVDLLIQFERLLTIDGIRPKSSRKAIGNSRRSITNAKKEANRIIKQTEEAGINAGEGFNQGLQSTLDRTQKTANELGQLTVDELKDTLEIRSPSRVAERLGKFFGEGFENGLNSLQDNILDQVKGLGIKIAGLFAGFKLLEVAGEQLIQFGRDALDAATAFQRIENTFKFVTGSSREAAEQIARIREESKSLGTDFSQGLEGFSQLAASTRGSSLEGAATEQLSSAVQQAAAVSQLDAESLNRANTAISQIAGKGKLSAEELRQQLAEVGGVFSGSFQIAARAVGVTTAELDQMLQRGEVLSEDFLPKFAQQLAAETATGVAGAAKTAQASINRFNNSVNELQVSVGEQLLPARQLGLELAADLMEQLVGVAPFVIQALGAIAGKLALDVAQGALDAAGGIKGLSKQFIGLAKTSSVTGIAASLKAATVSAIGFGKAMLSAVGPYLAVFGAIETIKIAKNSFSDLSGEVGEFSEQAAMGFNAFTEAVDRANGATSKLVETTRKLGQGDNLFTGTLVESLLGNAGGELLEEGIIDSRPIQAVNFVAETFGRDGVRSFRERQNDAQTIARNQLQSTVDQTLAASAFGPDVTQAIAELNDIDQQDAALSAQIRNATNAQEKAALRRQREDLLSRREGQARVVGSAQSTLATQQQLLQTDLSNLQGQIALDPENAADYRREIDQTQKLLEDIAKEQDRIANATKTNVAESAKLNREFSLIRAQSEDLRLDQQIDAANSRLRAAIAGQGVGSQARQQLQSEAEISDIEAQLRINKMQMEQVVKVLNDERINNAFQLVEAVDASQGANEILTRLEQAKETDEVLITQQFAEESAQLKELSAQTIELDAQLVQARTDLNDQARDLALQYRDLSEQISDFYRDALRSAEDVAGEIISQDFQNATQEISNDIRRELLGLEDSFVSGIGDTFTGLIESLRQPLLDELEAINQRNGIERQLEDSLRGARDLQRQADEFSFNAGLGPDPATGLPTPQSLNQQPVTRVIELTPEQAFGGGSFLGEPSRENTSPDFSNLQVAAPQFGQLDGTAFQNDDIIAANDLAQRSRDEQLAAIDRNLATQADNASLEVDTAIASIARQLEEGQRTVAEQSDGFARQLRDIGQSIGDSNPLRELESGLLSISDQFQDTNRDLEQFKRGLEDTVAETRAVRQQLLQGVASGLIGEEALAILPDLNQRISQFESALDRADDQIGQNAELFEAQRLRLIQEFQDAERDRRIAAQRRIGEGDAAINVERASQQSSQFNLGLQRAQGRARLLAQAEQESTSIAFEFSAELDEIEGLLETGELTKLEFSALKDNLVEINELRLDGIRSQFEELLPTVDAIASALGSATGEVNDEAFEQIRSNIRTARQAGILSDRQAEEARSGLSEAERFSRRSDAGTIRGLLDTDNAFTSQFLSQAGRGDLVGLADLGIQNREAERARRALSQNINTDPEALANELTRPELAQPSLNFDGFMQSSDRLIGALDKLTAAIQDGSSGGPTLNIERQEVNIEPDREQIAKTTTDLVNNMLSQRL
ncbi:MAG: tape measure protein [Cyanobacteria bacterium P01_F01_bin.150]